MTWWAPADKHSACSKKGFHMQDDDIFASLDSDLKVLEEKQAEAMKPDAYFLDWMDRGRRYEFTLTWLRNQAAIYFGMQQFEAAMIMMPVKGILSTSYRAATKKDIVETLLKYYIESTMLGDFHRIGKVFKDNETINFSKIIHQLMQREDIINIIKNS